MWWICAMIFCVCLPGIMENSVNGLGKIVGFYYQLYVWKVNIQCTYLWWRSLPLPGCRRPWRRSPSTRRPCPATSTTSYSDTRSRMSSSSASCRSGSAPPVCPSWTTLRCTQWRRCCNAHSVSYRYVRSGQRAPNILKSPRISLVTMDAFFSTVYSFA